MVLIPIFDIFSKASFPESSTLSSVITSAPKEFAKSDTIPLPVPISKTVYPSFRFSNSNLNSSNSVSVG